MATNPQGLMGMTGMGGPMAPSQEGSGVSAMDFSNPEGGEPQPNVSEAEQADYDMFVKNGFEVLYGTKEGEGPVQPQIIGRLSTGQDRQEALAQTAVWLTTMVETSAEQAGKPIGDEIVFHGGKALFEELVEISEAAGIHDYTEREMQGAWYKALDMYREANTKSEENPKGRIDADMLRGEFQQLDEADRVGEAKSLIGMDPSQAAEEANALAAMNEHGTDTEEPMNG